jgi:hypothetical protein
MRKVMILASELKCSIVVKDLASNRSLLSFLKSKNLISEFNVYAVDVKFGDDKGMEVSFSDTLFDEAVKIDGKNTSIIVPKEYEKEFREVVP